MSLKRPTNVIGAVIAGGKSTRMGTDKARLKIGEIELLEHARNALIEIEIKTVLISHADHIPDRVTGCGPLGGIDAILNASKNACSHIIFVPVDMPYLTADILSLLKRSDPESIAVRFSKFAFPFRLANTNLVRTTVKRRLDQGRQLSLMGLQSDLNCLEIDISESQIAAFTNLNSAEDWKQLNMPTGQK